MTDTLSREELDEIRGRDARAADDPHTWTVADRRALLAHIDALTAAVRALPHIQDEMFDGKAMIDRAAVLAILNGEHR
jgi:hypothetical protein